MMLVQYVRLLHNELDFIILLLTVALTTIHYTVHSIHITNRHEQDNSFKTHRHR